MRKSLLLVVVLVAVLGTAVAAAEYTYVDLVNKLTDLEALAVLPAPGESCASWSSYDRSSVYDEATGKYVNWNANSDECRIIRTEGDQEVLAEMDGPGCIWRIFSAAPCTGHVRIYLDGAAEPAVDLPFKQYFDLSHAPFVYTSLVHYTAGGANSYVPISFKKSCKITADKNWGAYFQFTYTKFPGDTVVPTFTPNLSSDEQAALKTVDSILSDKLGIAPAGKSISQTLLMNAVVAPGENVVVAKINGQNAITALKLKIDNKYTQEDLAGIILKIYWDGEKEPSVWAPLTSFFGSSPGINKYKSLPLGMTDDGLYSYWYMPFATGAVIELENDGETAFEAPFDIVYAPLSKPIAELGRFHAKWHRDAFIPFRDPQRQIDWPMLVTQGRGRYCGVMLEVWNPRGDWWGEGDEKFFVDGEKFPSTFGTGSDNYFGYAWGNKTLFQNAFHNQTRNIENRGHVSVNRWHIADNIPFQKSYEASIEKYYPNDRPNNYACVSYWYLAPGGVDSYKPVELSERNALYTRLPVFKVSGAIEGEQLKLISTTAGKTWIQEFDDERWSNAAQLTWSEGKVGDKLIFALPVHTTGEYELKIQLTKAKNYGMVQLFLDGQKLGESMDLCYENTTLTNRLSYGIHDLAAGEHKVTIEIIGSNEEGVKSYVCGIDYVKLEPLKLVPVN